MSAQKITPFLWYEKDAAAIVKYYTSVFGAEHVKLLGESELPNTPSGDVQVIALEMFGMELHMMTAGKHHEFNDAISFEVTCTDQDEIDRYWDALIKEGREQQCGWCIDKYGVRWQIVPANMGQYVSHEAGMKAMLGMKKIVIADLEKAVEGM